MFFHNHCYWSQGISGSFNELNSIYITTYKFSIILCYIYIFICMLFMFCLMGMLSDNPRRWDFSDSPSQTLPAWFVSSEWKQCWLTAYPSWSGHMSKSEMLCLSTGSLSVVKSKSLMLETMEKCQIGQVACGVICGWGPTSTRFLMATTRRLFEKYSLFAPAPWFTMDICSYSACCPSAPSGSSSSLAQRLGFGLEKRSKVYIHWYNV